MRKTRLLLAALLSLLAIVSAARAQSLSASGGYGSINGRVTGEDGPVAFARITVSPARGRGRDASSRNATADAEGNFKVDGLRAMAWSVSASAPGYVIANSSDEEGNQPYHLIGDNVTIRMVKGGVITGRVLSATGDPVIAVRVNTQIVRDSEGRQGTGIALRVADGDFQTDDRGVYRIYGLPAGSYVVVASAASGMSGPGGFGPGGRRSPYSGDAPVYHPSSTRDVAAEVVVNSGVETGGIDIQYRSEKGRAVSGKVTSTVSDSSVGFVSVTLTHAASGTIFNTAFIGQGGAGFGRGEASNNAFSMYGIPDGEYEVIAHRRSPGGESAASSPRRVVVSGRDVTGIDLVLKPLASITGNLQLESANKCENKRAASFEEQVFILDDDHGSSRDPQQPLSPSVVPDRTGDFVFRELNAGLYRIAPKMLDENWYIRSMTIPIINSTNTAKTTVKTAVKPSLSDVGRNGIAVKSGERVTGLIVTVVEGAAAIKGKVKGAEGARLPPGLQIHLVPMERVKADDALRYAEAKINGDGEFILRNLAPGKYWIVASPDTDRAKLRRTAETKNKIIELQPCQRLENYIINQ